MYPLSAMIELIRVENTEFGIRIYILSPGVALISDTDSEGQPALIASYVAEWVACLLARPAHLHEQGPILV